MCISDKFLSDVDAACPKTTLGEPVPEAIFIANCKNLGFFFIKKQGFFFFSMTIDFCNTLIVFKSTFHEMNTGLLINQIHHLCPRPFLFVSILFLLFSQVEFYLIYQRKVPWYIQ